MNVVTKVAAAMLLASLTAMPAFAAPPTKAAPSVKTAAPIPAVKMAAVPAKRVLSFRQIDIDHDGKISYAELRRYFPHLSKKEFAADDRNHDGYYERLDLVAFFKSPRNSVTPRPVLAKSVTRTVTTKTVTKTK